jgi:hypothetical protein
MKDKVYEQAVAQVREYVERHRVTRKDRFRILCDLTGVDEGTARIVDRYARAIREVLPPDAKCKALEKEWHKPEWMHDWEWELKKSEKQSQLI